jgi:hypothetical protein
MLTIGAAALSIHCLLIPPTGPQDPLPQGAASMKPDFRNAFTIVADQASNSPNLTREDLGTLLARLGMKRTPGDGDNWRRGDDAGQMWVSASFLADQTRVSLTFVPSVPAPVEGSVLSALLNREDSHVVLDGVDRVNVHVNTTPLNVDGFRGNRVETLTVSLAGEHVATQTLVVWSRGKRNR